jgi:hypothetical protein
MTRGSGAGLPAILHDRSIVLPCDRVLPADTAPATELPLWFPRELSAED